MYTMKKFEDPPHNVARKETLDLSRFLTAQEDTYTDVVKELMSGQKLTHWMWYVFPQLSGLAMCTTARHYAIKSLEDARQYFEHPILGARLIACTEIVNGLQGRTVQQIFGSPDNLKFCSSMTLFELIAGPKSDFSFALKKYFFDQRDAATEKLVDSSLIEMPQISNSPLSPLYK